MQTDLIFQVLLLAVWFRLWRVGDGVVFTALGRLGSNWWCWLLILIKYDWEVISFCSAPILKVLLSCFIMHENSSFPSQSALSTKHATMPIALCFLAKMKWKWKSGNGNLTYEVHFIALTCKNAVLTSKEFNVYLIDAITEQIRWRPSLKHVGLSVLKFCSSSKPLAHNFPLINFFCCQLISLWLPTLESYNLDLIRYFLIDLLTFPLLEFF